MDTSILLKVLVAAIVNFIIGSVWYMPGVFGKAWMKDVGLNKSKMTKDVMISALVTGFICYLITGYVLLQVPHAFMGSLSDMLTTVLLVWVGFIASVRLSHYAYEQKSFRLFWITSLHDLVGLISMGLVFWYWK